MHSPEISVLLPTTLAWPAVRPALDALLAQAEAPEFEILVLDGDGEGMTESLAAARVRWLRLPGHDTFALRAAGVAAARGRIVAVSEDHCVAPANWVAAIAAAHATTRTLAVMGATHNHADSATSSLDRANYLMTFAAQNERRLDLRARRLPVPTNLSFRRDALPDAELRPGELEYGWLARWNDAGAIGVSKSVVLHHRQCFGGAAPGIHLASGRSFGASVHEAPWRHRLHWWLLLPLLPLRLCRLVVPDLIRNAAGARGSWIDGLSVLALIAANVSGQVLGAMFGPGTSRQRL